MPGEPGGPSLWPFLVSFLAATLLWAVSLVPFTLALAWRPRRPRVSAGPPAAARGALLGLNGGARPYRVREVGDGRYRLEWDVVDASWYELFAKVKLSVVYKATLYLHAPAHEVRCYESLRTGSCFIGFEGWRPKLRWAWSYQGGALNVLWSGVAYGITRGFPPQIGRVYRFSLDTIAAKRDVETALLAVGWTFRPVPLPFEVTPWGARLGRLLTPPFMRAWSQRRFWGALQVVAWAGIFGSVLAFVPWTAGNLGVALLVALGILGVQALVIGTWKLLERQSARRARRIGG